MVTEDFNALLSTRDEVGGTPVTNYELQDMEGMVQICNLVELQSVGCCLAWPNGVVACKLD